MEQKFTIGQRVAHLGQGYGTVIGFATDEFANPPQRRVIVKFEKPNVLVLRQEDVLPLEHKPGHIRYDFEIKACLDCLGEN